MQRQNKLKVLIVCANMSTQAQFDQLKFLFSSDEIALNSTNQEAFAAGTKVSKFDVALLANFDDEATAAQMGSADNVDFYDYYMNAPVSAWVSTVSDRTSAKPPAGVLDKCQKQFEKDFPTHKAADGVAFLKSSV